MQSWIELCTAIVGAAGIVATALKLLANAMGRGFDSLAEETKALRAAVVDNTLAVQQNTAAKEMQRSGLMKKTAMLLLLPVLLLCASCASVQQQTVSDLEFARKAWREDKAKDLELRVIEAREKFFATAIETAQKGTK